LIDKRLADLQPSRELLRRSVEQTVRTIEGAVALSLIGETEFTRYKGEAESIEGAIERTTNFRKAMDRLNGIQEELAQKSGPHLESARRRFEEQLRGRVASPEYDRIRALLDRNDFLTANEYLDRLERGDLLPDADSDTARFRRVFPESLQHVDSLSRRDQFLRELVQTIRERKGLLHIDLQKVLSRDQAEYAAGVLGTWFRVKRAKGAPLPTAEDIRDILAFLGFTNAHVSGADRTSRLPCYPVRCDVPKCPIPTYGSAAEGRYRVVCAFDRKNEADIVEDLGVFPTGAPFIVLYFSRMGPQERRNLAQLCRTDRRTLLLVDDLILTWLCTVKPSRIQALFEVVLPFTHLRPYTSKPGFVPREMFYGRERERESIANPSGACFIFGGRQLGKSALLRQVRDSFHNLETGHIAILLDLANSVRIAIERPIEDLWIVLQRELELVKFNFRGDINAGPDALFLQIEAWLREDTSRRMLLLLDEADDFFDIDARQNFAYVRRFKELMEKPGIDRRFKVVFAGLHNVQRTTRDVNNPLAHLQDAICIGPLLESGEWRQAQALIERPLASLGYFFESRDLLMPILSKTNYYPSLIQLFCIRLIEEFDDPRSHRFDSKQSPPYILRKEHVDRICTDLELRNQIKFRFDLTLDLDPRYRAIAYTVAWETIYQQARILKDGIDWQTIRTRALELSPSEIWGYTAEDNFRVLVDEMVGLGILRRVTENESRYALRSPNVLSFMGTDDDIYDGLQRIRREKDVRYDAASFRASLPGDAAQAYIRSPLTAEQISTLTQRKNGVSLLFGSGALGFNNLPEFLEAGFDARFTVTCSATNDAEFRSWTDDLRKRDLQNLILALVPANCPWSAAWVESALARVGRLRSERGHVRFLFLADPVKTWSWFGETAGRRKQMIEAGLATFELQKWHDQALAQWTSECRLILTPEEPADIGRLTGHWPILIMELFRLAHPSLRMSVATPKLTESLQNPAHCSAVLADMGFASSSVGREVLNAIGCNPTTAADVRDYFNDDAVYSNKTIARAFDWAEKLQLVRAANSPSGIQTWTVDPVVADLLKTVAGAAVHA
jgi:hypothetical protein